MSRGGVSRKIAVYAGSFDPITNGHIDIIRRSLKVFDELHVVVAVNPSKKYFFSKEERVDFIQESLKNTKGLKIVCYDGLLVRYAKKVGAKVLVRSLRATSDFDYEFHMSTMNQELCPDIETFFVATSSKYFYINSSIVKEIAKYRADISLFVPKIVAKKLLKSKTLENL